MPFLDSREMSTPVENGVGFELFALIMEHAPNLVFVKDENSVIHYANKAFLDIYPPEQHPRIIGHYVAEDFSSDQLEIWRAEDRRAFEYGISESVEEIVSYTGRKRTFLTRKIRFTTASGERRILGIGNDITELLARERELVELNERLQSFSALAAHDLRSPLATFVSALNLIKRDKNTSLSETAQRYIDLIIGSATGLATNISTLLIASKADKDRSVLYFCKSDLNLLLAKVKFNLTEKIERSGALIEVDRLPQAVVEPSLFQQLFQNLIENSLKSHDPGRQLAIAVKHEERDGAHVFLVEDNGIGVPRDFALRAFDMYAQESHGGIKGVGLGLSLCKRIVDLHAGRIWIDPSSTSGCRIRVAVPIRDEGHSAQVLP